MLYHKFGLYGRHFLTSNIHYRLSFVSHHFISYDQHESPTVPPHTHPNPTVTLTEKLPLSCGVLIAGGGIIGQSIAYHLSDIGIKDIVLVEKAK